MERRAHLCHESSIGRRHEFVNTVYHMSIMTYTAENERRGDAGEEEHHRSAGQARAYRGRDVLLHPQGQEPQEIQAGRQCRGIRHHPRHLHPGLAPANDARRLHLQGRDIQERVHVDPPGDHGPLQARRVLDALSPVRRLHLRPGPLQRRDQEMEQAQSGQHHRRSDEDKRRLSCRTCSRRRKRSSSRSSRRYSSPYVCVYQQELLPPPGGEKRAATALREVPATTSAPSHGSSSPSSKARTATSSSSRTSGHP